MYPHISKVTAKNARLPVPALPAATPSTPSCAPGERGDSTPPPAVTASSPAGLLSPVQLRCPPLGAARGAPQQRARWPPATAAHAPRSARELRERADSSHSGSRDSRPDWSCFATGWHQHGWDCKFRPLTTFLPH